MEAITLKTFDPVREPMLSLGFSKEKFEKEARFALQIWNDPKNEYLRKSTKDTLLKSLVNIAQTGLTLNPVSKEAFLIPRYSSYAKCVECHLEPSYIGLVKLITDTGSVSSIQTNLVHEKDEFDMLLGSEVKIAHRPATKARGDIIGVYSVAQLTSGEKQIEYMTIDEVNEIRDISEGYKAFKDGKAKSSIWETWYSEMVRKTCLKRITKYLPRSNSEHLDTAIELTNRDFLPSDRQVHYAINLIRASTLIEPTKEQLERELSTCNVFQLSNMINHLQEHQPNPITDLGAGNLGDINRQLDLKMQNDRQ